MYILTNYLLNINWCGFVNCYDHSFEIAIKSSTCNLSSKFVEIQM